jgi:hypothetical protein
MPPLSMFCLIIWTIPVIAGLYCVSLIQNYRLFLYNKSQGKVLPGKKTPSNEMLCDLLTEATAAICNL